MLLATAVSVITTLETNLVDSASWCNGTIITISLSCINPEFRLYAYPLPGPLKLHAYGHMRLRALLSDTHLPQRFTQAGCIIQCSSLGSLDEKWLKQEFMASMTAGRIEGTAKTPKLERSASRTAAPVVAAAGKGDAFALMAAASRAHTAAAAGGTAADVPLYIVW